MKLFLILLALFVSSPAFAEMYINSYSGTNVIRATNYVTVRMLYFNNSANPPVQLQMMQVDTVWPFTVGTNPKYFTNSIATYFAPDNRDPGTL